MFAMGQDADFQGLQVKSEVPETYANGGTGGIDIQLGKLENEISKENALIFNRDVDESLEDE